MSTKKIKHIEQPKTKDRASMLAFQAQLRGEAEEESQKKMSKKRFALIALIIIAVLVGGLMYVTSHTNYVDSVSSQVNKAVQENLNVEALVPGAGADTLDSLYIAYNNHRENVARVGAEEAGAFTLPSDLRRRLPETVDLTALTNALNATGGSTDQLRYTGLTEDAYNGLIGSYSVYSMIRMGLILVLIIFGLFTLIKLLQPKRRKPNRSFWGDLGIYLVMLIFAVAMAFPLVFSIASSLKPLDELFRFPPRVFPSHVTLDNFSDLIVTMGQSWVPFSRYRINTVLITAIGTFGHVLIASMAAFVLAKYDFPGGKTFFNIVVTALMFSGYVTGIPNYVTMSKLHMIDTYWAIILPAFAAPIGLFLMKQFMESLPTALIEAAHLDGAGEFRIIWSIIMPNVKPAWLSIIIFSVQSLWNTNAATVI